MPGPPVRRSPPAATTPDSQGAPRVSTDVRNVIIIGSGPAGLHRRRLRRPGQPQAAGLRGRRHRRWRADEHHRGRELPRLPRRHHGPRPDGEHAGPGRAVRRRAGHRRRESRSASRATVKTVTDGEGNATGPAPSSWPWARPTASSACPTRSGSPATASRGAPPATGSSSATRTSPWSAAATPRSRRPPSSPSSPAR